MAKVSLICEQCGGNVVLDDAHEFGYCSHCKAKVLIKSDTIINEVTQNITKHVYGLEGKDVDELVADGNSLHKLGDTKNANAKYKQAISIEPNNWDAWLGYAATGGDGTGYISCVPAYRKAYNVAAGEAQEAATFTSMTSFLADHGMGAVLVESYKASPPQKRHEMFNLVLGVIGRDESEIAKLVIDLCPYDWRAWFAQAKIRQIRVRWCQMEGNMLTGKRLPKDANDVLNVFMQAYLLARNASEEAKRVVLSHIAEMSRDSSYTNFTRELNAHIMRAGC